MKLKIIFIIILAILLGASLFLNGWFLHERTVQTPPENIPGWEGGNLCKDENYCGQGKHCTCEACGYLRSKEVEDLCKAKKGSFGDGTASGCCEGGGLPF